MPAPRRESKHRPLGLEVSKLTAIPIDGIKYQEAYDYNKNLQSIIKERGWIIIYPSVLGSIHS